VFIVCIRNTAKFKLLPILCTHVYSYMFSIVHPPSVCIIRTSANVGYHALGSWIIATPTKPPGQKWKHSLAMLDKSGKASMDRKMRLVSTNAIVPTQILPDGGREACINGSCYSSRLPKI
jgi:hypothetical protein